VFIHGLGGHSIKSWTAKGEVAPWPQTLLPTAIPTARVLTFTLGTPRSFGTTESYGGKWLPNSSVLKSSMELLAMLRAARSNIRSMERPIIFVCHSLGGLVCKEVSHVKCYLMIIRSHTTSTGPDPVRNGRGTVAESDTPTDDWHHLPGHSARPRRHRESSCYI
jgi:hypothetical protein